MEAPSAEQLRSAIMGVLRRQGYRVRNGTIHLPNAASKEDYRATNRLAVRAKLEKSGPGVRQYESRLLQYIANGHELDPMQINPVLVQVDRGSESELLFRYACLHWSVPVSAGYGRRLRFLVMDQSNGKLMGLFGLGDPVYSMKARDEWIGWSKEMKAEKLYHVMDAYVLGAVPPYSFLLGGKLVAMLVCSKEVRKAFRDKYSGRTSVIRRKDRPPYLVLVTTTSALGRSSVYNRIRVKGWTYWNSLGFTQGSGEFHFSNGVYDAIRAYVEKNCEPTGKHQAWGTGFRNKREVIRKCLSEIGLSGDLIYHGIQREIFAAPLGRNALRFLRGEVQRPCFCDWPAVTLWETFRDRWLRGRAKRKPEYRAFRREQYQLWAKLK